MFACVYLYGLYWFSEIYISQSSAAMRLWYVEIFDNHFAAHFS